jgi:hypothetical protein
MATGDKAAAAGLKTYTSAQDRRLGFDNDNQRGDEIADVMARAAALEALSFKELFIVNSNRNTPITGNAENALVAADWAPPTKNIGFDTWSAGKLKILTPGDYMIIFSMGSVNGITNGQAYIKINGISRGFQNGSNATSTHVATLAAGAEIQPWIYATANSTTTAERVGFTVRRIG